MLFYFHHKTLEHVGIRCPKTHIGTTLVMAFTRKCQKKEAPKLTSAGRFRREGNITSPCHRASEQFLRQTSHLHFRVVTPVRLLPKKCNINKKPGVAQIVELCIGQWQGSVAGNTVWRSHIQCHSTVANHCTSNTSACIDVRRTQLIM